MSKKSEINALEFELIFVVDTSGYFFPKDRGRGGGEGGSQFGTHSMLNNLLLNIRAKACMLHVTVY